MRKVVLFCLCSDASLDSDGSGTVSKPTTSVVPPTPDLLLEAMFYQRSRAVFRLVAVRCV